MDKPVSMSVKDYLVRTLAVKILTSEKVIETIINHQFQSANEAMHQNNSVELAGFGKFYFNTKKAVKKLEALNAKHTALQNIIDNPETTEQKRKSSKIALEKSLALKESLNLKTTYED